MAIFVTNQHTCFDTISYQRFAFQILEVYQSAIFIEVYFTEHLIPLWQFSTQASSEYYIKRSSVSNIADESQDFIYGDQKKKCFDFIWEYPLVKSSLSRKAIYYIRMYQLHPMCINYILHLCMCINVCFCFMYLLYFLPTHFHATNCQITLCLNEEWPIMSLCACLH